MTRSFAERMATVQALVNAARVVAADRAQLVDEIVRCTGLSSEGVELGFTRYLELTPSHADLKRLVERTPETTAVHVVLSANVFTAPLRALALARAASPRVTVHPSTRDPTLTRALLKNLGDGALLLEDSRDVARVTSGEIHVYGKDQTIADVRARAAPGVIVRGHGTGMGVVFVSRTTVASEAAQLIASDVVAFDQRGCLSPRIVVCEGGPDRGAHLAQCLHEALAALARAVPRGALSVEESAEAARYADALTFAGRVWHSADHIVGLAPTSAPLLVPPAGRHVHVATSDVSGARELLAPVQRFVVAVGVDDRERWQSAIPAHARVSSLGEMQHPPLDGPVDRRA